MTQDEAEKIAANNTEIGRVVSNFDGVVDEDIAVRLKADPHLMADFPGWNFHAVVFYSGKKYHALVRRYCVVVAVVSADDVDGLRTLINDSWGWE